MAMEKKINRGLIMKNCQQICIDQFSSFNGDWNLGRAFFLTHYDDDILAEVLSSDFLTQLGDNSKTHCLYLHQIVFNLLKYWTTTHLYENDDSDDDLVSKLDELLENCKIVLLDTNVPIQLQFSSSPVVAATIITPLSSGSNAGCIMLLIESSAAETILYTGSCRVLLKDLQQCSALHNLDGTVKKIDKVYLDTTYCLEDVHELPKRSIVVEELAQQIITEIEMDNESKQFEFKTNREMKINNLFFLQKLAEFTKEIVHVPYELELFLRKLGFKKNGLINSTAKDSTHIHYDCADSNDNEECCSNDDMDFKDDFEVSPISLTCNMENTFGKSQELDFNEWNNNGQSIYTTKKCGLLSFHGIYSNHLSFYEMGRLLNYLHVSPFNVLPLFLTTGLNTDEIEISLEYACDAKTEPEYLSNELPSYYFDFTGNFGSTISTVKTEIQKYFH